MTRVQHCCNIAVAVGMDFVGIHVQSFAVVVLRNPKQSLCAIGAASAIVGVGVVAGVVLLCPKCNHFLAMRIGYLIDFDD